MKLVETSWAAASAAAVGLSSGNCVRFGEVGESVIGGDGYAWASRPAEWYHWEDFIRLISGLRREKVTGRGRVGYIELGGIYMMRSGEQTL
jgi:hypothetical protein